MNNYLILVLIALAGAAAGIFAAWLIMRLFKKKNEEPIAECQTEPAVQPEQENKMVVDNLIITKGTTAFPAIFEVTGPKSEMKAEPAAVPAISYNEWLQIETDNVNSLIDEEADPLKYIDNRLKIAKKENQPEHCDALISIQNLLRAKEDASKEDITKDRSAEGDAAVYAPNSERKAEEERSAFITAKHEGSKHIPVPMLRFTMSRNDIIDYLQNAFAVRPEVFPNGIFVQLRGKRTEPDFVKIGDLTFGLIYGTILNLKISLRLGEMEAEQIKRQCAVIVRNAILGADWYDIAVDSSFIFKEEVFKLFNTSYDYTLKNYFGSKRDENGARVLLNFAGAKAADEKLEQTLQSGLKQADPIWDNASEEYYQALATFNAAYPLNFKATRAHILHYYRTNNENGAVSINENEQRLYLPAALKYNGRTFALLYRKLDRFSMVVRMEDAYAKTFELTHPTVRRAQFPKGKYWYLCDVNGAFPDLPQVYRVLENAKAFIQELYAKNPTATED